MCVAPRPGDIVVMDTLSSHKVVAVYEVIEDVGASLRSVPRGSPDLNSIELAFSKLPRLFETGLAGNNRSTSHRRIVELP